MTTIWGDREPVSAGQSILLKNAVAQHIVDELLKAWKEADVSALDDQAIREPGLLQKGYLRGRRLVAELCTSHAVHTQQEEYMCSTGVAARAVWPL